MTNRRIAALGVTLITLLAGLLIQFYRLQVCQHEKWVRIARSQHEGIVKIPFRRGKIFAKDTLLTHDVAKFHLHADPKTIPSKFHGEIEEGLSELTGMPKEQIHDQLILSSRNRRLKRWMDEEEKQRVMQWWLPFARKNKIARNALFFLHDYKRCLPYGHLLGHCLHTIRDYKDEITQEGMPTGGLEAYFDPLLQGKEGVMWATRSPRRRLAGEQIIEPAHHGADIHLTIDPNIQAICEAELKEWCDFTEAKSAWAIMIEPNTGAILAFAQHPPFYPENYRDYFNDPERIKEVVIKGLTDSYEPGSIMKPLTACLCLDAGVLDPEEKVDLRSGVFPGRSKPITDSSPLSFANLDLATQRSSNRYFGRMVLRMCDKHGVMYYRNKLQDCFGFGVKSGIELPAECCGFLPMPGLTYPSGAVQWSRAAPPSLAIGYNLTCTGLQMARAFTTIANGGYLVTPTLIDTIESNSEVVYSLQDHLVCNAPKQVFKPGITDRVKRSLRFVTQPGGTAYTANIAGYTEAGKTGTAEKVIDGAYDKKTHVTSCVGFTPVDDPAFVLLVQFDEPSAKIIPGYGAVNFGRKSAAPAFRAIATKTLAYLGIPPDDPYDYPLYDPRRDPDKQEWAQELKDLAQLSKSWNN